MNIYETYDITLLMFLNMLDENVFENSNDYKFIIQDEVFRFDIKTKKFVRDLGHGQERIINSTNFKDLNETITVIHVIGNTDIEEEESNE